MEKKEYTGRGLPNVMVLGKLAEGTPKEEEIHPQPQPVIVPIEPEPEPEPTKEELLLAEIRDLLKANKE